MALTSASIKKSLQIANCCAAQKGIEYIALLKKGKKDANLLAEASLMVDLIDAIKGFTPEGEVIVGQQGCATFVISPADVAAPGTFSVTVAGTPAYTVAIVVGDPGATTTSIVAVIRSFFPQNYPYSATDNLNSTFEVCGSDYDNDNGTSVTVTVGTNPVQPLAGGIAAEFQLEEDNCITNQGVESILEKLSILCDTPCEELLNFSAV